MGKSNLGGQQLPQRPFTGVNQHTELVDRSIVRLLCVQVGSLWEGRALIQESCCPSSQRRCLHGPSLG